MAASDAPRAAGTASAAPAASSVRGTVFRGSAWQTAGRLIPQAYTLVTSIVAAHVLGAAGVGRLSFILFVELTLVTLFTAGFPGALARFVAEAAGAGRPGAIRALASWFARFEAFGAFAGGAVLVVIALLGAEPQSAWFFAAIACSAGILQAIPSNVLVGLQRWREATIVGLVTGVLATIAKVSLLASGYGIPALLAVDAVVRTVNYLGSEILARWAMARAAARREPAPDLVQRAWRYGLVASASVLLTYIVWGRSEVFFLERFSDDVEIALYSLPFSAVTLLMFVPMSIGIAAGQAFAFLFGARKVDRIGNAYARSVRMLLLVVLPLTAVSMALGPLAFRVVFGSAFAGTRPVLLVMVSVLPIISAMYLATALLVGLGRLRMQVVAAGIAAVVDIGLALALVPPWGAVGAAFANAGAQTLAALLLVFAARRAVGKVELELPALARQVVVSVAAGLVATIPIAFLSDPVALAAGIVLFGLVFAGLSALAGIVSDRDADWLSTGLGGRIGGLARWVARVFRVRPFTFRRQ
jgi:O-antigen/teichoic acid export membrane protein